MTFMSESDLSSSPPRIYEPQNDSHVSSLDSIDDFDININIDENHFALPTNISMVWTVNYLSKIEYVF